MVSEEWSLMKKKKVKRQRNESALGSYGFANEGGRKQVSALDFSNSSIGHGRFRARSTDDLEAIRLAGKRIEFGGK